MLSTDDYPMNQQGCSAKAWTKEAPELTKRLTATTFKAGGRCCCKINMHHTSFHNCVKVEQLHPKIQLEVPNAVALEGDAEEQQQQQQQ